jgi:hypothetical protein
MDLKHRSKSSADIRSIENPFLFIPENGGSDLVVLSKDSHSSVLRELTGMDGKKVSGSLSNTIEALLPDNIFPSSPTAVDMAISQRQAVLSPALSETIHVPGLK